MDKFEQIAKLAEAYSLITEVVNANDEHAEHLQDIANTLADISDEIEGSEVG